MENDGYSEWGRRRLLYALRLGGGVGDWAFCPIRLYGCSVTVPGANVTQFVLCSWSVGFMVSECEGLLFSEFCMSHAGRATVSALPWFGVRLNMARALTPPMRLTDLVSSSSIEVRDVHAFHFFLSPFFVLDSFFEHWFLFTISQLVTRPYHCRLTRRYFPTERDLCTILTTFRSVHI